MEFEFVKMHGCAADAILIDCVKTPVPAAVAAANAPWMCDRRTGIGADFVVLLLPDARADARVQAFGPTGSEMLSCADAVRLAAEYLFDSRRVRSGVARIATAAGVLTAMRNATGLVTVELPQPQLEAEAIPLPGRSGRVLDKLVEAGGEACTVSCIGIGGAHCVLFRHTGGVDLCEFGMRCRRSSFFYGGECVTLAEQLGEKRLRARVWRYQAGELPAISECAAAAVAVASLTGRVREGAEVAVELPGGVLTARWDGKRLFVTGEAVRVFQGTVTLGDA